MTINKIERSSSRMGHSGLALIGEMEPDIPVRTGLYFPMISAWREV